MNRKLSEADRAENKDRREAKELMLPARFLELFGIEVPEAIFVPDSGVVGRSIKGREELEWTAPAFRDEYATGQQMQYTIKETARGEPIVGASGGKARDLAAVHLANAFPDSIVVPMSRFDVPQNETTRAQVNPPTEHYQINADYIARQGIERDRIQPETESTTIFEGIIQMLRICKERGIKNAVFVTNDYNVPRAQAMIEALQNSEKGIKKKLAYMIGLLNDKYQKILGVKVDNSRQNPKVKISQATEDLIRNITITVIPAEKVLGEVNSKYSTTIAAAHTMPAYQARARTELNGAQQILDGTYGKASWENRFGKTA